MDNAKIKKYKQLAEKKPKYYALIGDLYMEEADFANAAVYYKKAIAGGVLAYTALGDTFDYRHEYKKSFNAYSTGVESGETECFNRLAYCYQNGHAVKKDTQKAIEYYTKASDLGSATAARNLGDLCLPPDYEKGLNYLSDGVKHNDPESLYMQARIYEEGWYNVAPTERNIFITLKKRRTLARTTHCSIWGIITTTNTNLYRPNRLQRYKFTMEHKP